MKIDCINRFSVDSGMSKVAIVRKNYMINLRHDEVKELCWPTKRLEFERSEKSLLKIFFYRIGSSLKDETEMVFRQKEETKNRTSNFFRALRRSRSSS